jgi:hypothetical protein
MRISLIFYLIGIWPGMPDPYQQIRAEPGRLFQRGVLPEPADLLVVAA